MVRLLVLIIGLVALVPLVLVTNPILVAKEPVPRGRDMFSVLSAVVLVREGHISLKLSVTVIGVSAGHLELFQELLLALEVVGRAWLIWIEDVADGIQLVVVQVVVIVVQGRHLRQQGMSSILPC